MTNEDKLTWLLLKGWQVFDWNKNFPEPGNQARVKNELKQYVENTHRYKNLDKDEFGEFLILSPSIASNGVIVPPGGTDMLPMYDYYTISKAWQHEYGQ